MYCNKKKNFKIYEQPDTFYDVLKVFILLIFCNNHLHKCCHFINFVTLASIIGDSLRMMYKHRNMWERFKKQILLICVVNLLDK